MLAKVYWSILKHFKTNEKILCNTILLYENKTEKNFEKTLAYSIALLLINVHWKRAVANVRLNTKEKRLIHIYY